MSSQRLVPIVVDERFVSYMDGLRVGSPGSSLLEACSDSVVVFAERMLGVRLYSWQVDFLSRLSVVCNSSYEQRKELPKEFAVMTSRQVGKSFGVAIFMLWAAVFNKYPGAKSVTNNTLVGVISASDEQAKKLLGEVKKLIAIGDLFMKNTYPDSGLPDKVFSRLVDDDGKNNVSTISFRAWEPKDGSYFLRGSTQGSVIKSHPPTSVVLGETFSVLIVDEAGMSSRISDVFYNEYIYPTGNARDAIRVAISTPWESSGFFYRLIDPDGNQGSEAVRLCYTIDAIRLENPDYYDTVMKIVNRMKKDGLLDEVQRAYYCRFVKGELSYFNPDSVKKAFLPDLSMVTEASIPCDLGVDFGGQTHSHTVVTVSALINDQVVRLYHYRYPIREDKGLMEDIESLMRHFNIQRVIPDDCPAGWLYIKQMQDKGWNVHPMQFRSEKVKKYGAFRALLNRGKSVSYVDDKLMEEMLALQFEQHKVNSVISPASGYTDDLIDSWVMSSYFYLLEDNDFRVYDVDDAGEVDPFDS